MTHPLSRILLAVLFVVLALSAAISSADIVTLKDGTVIEGTVIKEDGGQVVIETIISNIKATKTFPRYKVRSIEYKPVEEVGGGDDQGKPEDSTEKKDTTASKTTDDTTNDTTTPPTATADEDSDDLNTDTDDPDLDDSDLDDDAPRRAGRRGVARTMFMVIPVEGIIGEQTTAQGLKNALAQAQRKRVKHIVFTIDSPGGYIYDAVEVLKVLKENDDAFVYHAYVVEGAISAASVYVAAADDIWVRPDARVGGAVSYSKDQTTGAAEVDAKMNSIWAAEIAARAESKGYPPELFRAMAEPGAEVWVDQDNKVYPSRPSTQGAQQLDSSTTVFTMRAGQMVQLGMAREFSGEAKDMGEVLGIEDWSELRAVGRRAMEAVAKERAQLTERLDVAVKYFLKQAKELEATDPRKFSDYRAFRIRNRYTETNREYAPDGPSLNRWRERSRNAITACDRILDAIREIADIDKQAEKIGAVQLMVQHDVGDNAFEVFTQLRQWLWDHRDSVPSEMFIDGATVGP